MQDPQSRPTKPIGAPLKFLQPLQECRSLLAKYRSELANSACLGNQQHEPPFVIVDRVFDFVDRSVIATDALLQVGDSYAVFACTISRSAFETAVRVLWGARTEYGWQRLQAYWVDEDNKWAKEAVKIPSLLAAHATAIRPAQEAVLQRIGPSGKRFDPAPGMRMLLRDIEKYNVEDALFPPDVNFAARVYTNVYRVLCRSAHGHISAIGPLPPGSNLPTVRSALVFAVLMTIQTANILAAVDPQEETRSVAMKLMRLLNYSNEAIDPP